MRTIAQKYIEEGEAKGKAEGEARGKTEGKIEGKIEVAKNLLKCGLSVDLIAQSTGLTIEQIGKLKSS